MSGYCDIHAHLTREEFEADWPELMQKIDSSDLETVVVNGMDPPSNRRVLELARLHPVLKPALGIYPINAICHLVQGVLPFEVPLFDVDEEIDFIDQQAANGELWAIGECGLDGYWVKDNTFAEQERVFVRLIEIAQKHDLPLIIHTRKLERRSMEILEQHKVKRVDFHCFGGKVKLALQGAREHGWWFSIPANARRNQAFTKMLNELPQSSLLTETDCPFLAREPGQRSDPTDVVHTINYLAELKEISIDQAKDLVWNNFVRLMGR